MYFFTKSFKNVNQKNCQHILKLQQQFWHHCVGTFIIYNMQLREFINKGTRAKTMVQAIFLNI